MFVADAAQLGRVRLAVRIVQNAAAGQMVDGIAKPLAATTPHEYLPAFATLPGHWRSPAVCAEGIVVPLGDRIRALGEEMRGKEASPSRNREE